MVRRLLIGLFVASLAASAATAQTSAPRDLPAHVELHPYQSLTIPDQQFLVGARDGGAPVTIAGELSIAQGTGRLPAVVLMHGSGGIGGNVPYWTRHLNGMGVSTFVIDGMTGRGLTGVGSDQAKLGRLNFIIDIYRALDILAKHPRVDPDRIALMGFSRGGQGALYASLERFHRLWNASGARFAAYVAFYPDCATAYREDTAVVGRPIRVFHGAPDDYNPVATCKAYVARLREAGADVELTKYPDAPHGFDNPLGANPARPAARDQSVRECGIREGDGGVLINRATDAPFTYGDACVRLGPHVGHDPEAARAATAAVTGFLQSVLKP